MKKIYLIATVALVMMTSCKKDPSTDVNADGMNDSTAVETSVVDSTATATDSTATDSTSADLLNKISVEKTTTTTDPADGKFTLSENKWILTELNGKAVANKTTKEYFINLDSKSGKFVGFAGCNNLKGSYVMTKPGKLSLTNIISTKMACNEIKMENDFVAALGKVDNYMVDGDMLHLHKGKTAVAKFTIKK